MKSPPSHRRRPFGVYAIIGLLLIRVALIAFDLWRIGQGQPALSLLDLNNDRLLGVIAGATIVALLAICWGLFRLKRWAWITMMILIGFNLLVAITGYLNGGKQFVPMLLDVISVFYLNLRSVQAAFQGEPVPPQVPA
jgi:hypothetical protein